MRIGTLIWGSTIDEIVANVEMARQVGYQSAWLTDGSGMDPLTALAVVGREVPGIELGTAVVRTFPRHPMELAQQALTVNAMLKGRLTLGIGPSHRPAIEGAWGLSFEHPVRHVREYLSVLGPLLEHGAVSFDGDTVSAHGTIDIEGAVPCSILLGALGPRMLELAGSSTDGAITFMVGPRTLTGLTCPTVRRVAEEAGRPPPRVVALLALCVTDAAAAARQKAVHVNRSMARMPSYSSMIEREGGPPLVAGTEGEVLEQLAALDEAGVSDLTPLRLARRGSEDDQRTEALIRGLIASSPPPPRNGP